MFVNRKFFLSPTATAVLVVLTSHFKLLSCYATYPTNEFAEEMWLITFVCLSVCLLCVYVCVCLSARCLKKLVADLNYILRNDRPSASRLDTVTDSDPRLDT